MTKNTKPSENILVRSVYFVTAVLFCIIYYIKIVVPADFNSQASVNAVLAFTANKPFQFRLLFPFIFYIFDCLHLIPQKTLIIVLALPTIYSIIIVYKKICGIYFPNLKFQNFLPLLIIYPLFWNYIILNQTFQYYDFLSILLFTLGLYFIITQKPITLIIIFTLAVINKESAGYLVIAFILYNYRNILKKENLLTVSSLIVIFAAIKLFLNYIFRNNPGDVVEIPVSWNIDVMKNLFSNKIYFKNIFFGFGGLYAFPFLVLFFRSWKKFNPDYGKTFIFFIYFIYMALGFWIVVYTEVRVYAELIPAVTSLCLIYLSTFKFLKSP